MQKGDQQAFAELYESCYSPIYYYVFGMTYSKEESEDITQETFMKVAKSIHTFKIGNVMAWMYTIARNILFDKSRKSKRTTPLQEEHENTLGYEPDVDAMLKLESDLAKLHEGMLTLLPRERELLILKYWNGLDMSKIAEVVGKSHVAVRKEISRIIGKLRNNQEETVYEHR